MAQKPHGGDAQTPEERSLWPVLAGVSELEESSGLVLM